jgi:hypothetical protein
MKFLTTLFALAILSATASAQTIKALGYDTASGEVVANTGTNVLTFTNRPAFVGINLTDGSNIKFVDSNENEATISFIEGNSIEFAVDNAIALLIEGGENTTVNFSAPFQFLDDEDDAIKSATRDNLGLPLPALTNTSNADMLSALGAAQTIFTVKTNDQTIIDETNATTITDLTFATEPGARYVVTFVPIVEDGAFIQIIASNALVFGNWNQVGIAFASTNPITNEATIGTSGTIRSPVQVFYVEGDTNAGAISATFRGATNTTNTIKAGSFLRADKMP